MKPQILKFWPTMVIALSWFILSSPYFLNNKVPYPATYQNSFFSPWSSYEQFAVPVKNNALSDVVLQIYPWKHFTIEELKKGSIPWWNPFSFSGNPHAADSQTAVFSPFNILFFILPFIDAWSLLILFQPLLAGFFMFLFLNKLKISKEGSLLGSITFMFCGFIVVWMPYGTLAMTIAFLPLALYAIQRCFERPSFFALILLTVSLIFSFFSGHFQTSLYLAVFCLAYLYFKLQITKNGKTALKVLGFFCLGIAISLVQIIPSLEIYKNSVRSGLFSNEGGIPFSYLITVLAPDFYGNPVTGNEWVGNYAEWASFIGIIPLLLACISLLRKKSHTLFFLLSGITALILAINTPLQELLTHLKLPVFSTSIPSRIIVLFSFSFAVLAAYGLDTLKYFLEKDKRKKIMLICVGMASLILVIWSLLFAFKVLPQDKIMIAARNLLIPTFSLFVAIGLISLNFKIKRKFYINIVIYSLIIITLIDSLHFSQKWIPFEPKELIFPDVPVITAMQKNVGAGRVYGKFGSYIDTYYLLSSIEGYDPLYIRRYGEFLVSASSGSYQPAVKSLAVLDKNAKYAGRVLDLLGVTVLFHVIGDTGRDWAFPVWKKNEYGDYLYSVIYQDDKFQLYSNKTALPRAKLFYEYEVIKNDKDIINRFYSKDFDFRNKLILEEKPGLKTNKIVEKGSHVKIISYTPNKVIIDIESNRPGLLFLSDNYYPKWKVHVNGQEGKIFRTDYTLRSVVVPEGKSKVEFYYDVWKVI